MKTAVYAASLDPITYGHINIIKRALEVFDHIVVAIGNNSSKKYTLDLTERENLARQSLDRYGDRVSVTSFTGLLVDFAYSQSIKTIIRGIRGTNDVEYEQLLNDINKSQKLGIDTFVLFADKELSHISSSAVKELQLHHAKNILEYVPMVVKSKLEKVISKHNIIGVTGEIGAGKSYIVHQLVARFHHLSILNIDFDILGHYILEKGTQPVFRDMRTRIINRFGLKENPEIHMSYVPKSKDDHRFINRKQLGSLLWGNCENLKWFNSVIMDGLDYLYRSHISRFKEGIVMVNGALLAEANLLHLCNNNVVVIEASQKTRFKRLEARGYSGEEIAKRMNSQLSADYKVAIIKKKIEEDRYGSIIRFNNEDPNLNELSELWDQIKGM